MPPITLDAGEVATLLAKIDVLDELRSLFRELDQDQAVQPPQTLALFPDDKGDFITYLGALAGAGVFGAKLSPYLVTPDRSIVTAWILLMSMQTGQPLMLCDSQSLTTERTAATSALAVDLLLPNKPARLAIIGSSAIAQAHWRHVRELREWQSLLLYSPNLAQDRARRDTWTALSEGVSFKASAEEAARDADVVLLCTSSGKPVIESQAIPDHALVTSISTNAPQAHEVAPGFLSGAQVYCDYRETTPGAAGDMQLAVKEQGWDPKQILGDLPELVTARCPMPNPARPVYFRSIGLGLEDIAIANAVYRAASSD